MKESNQSDKALSRVLQEWKVADGVPEGFEKGVWRRIENKQMQANAWQGVEGVWRGFLDRIAGAFAKPSLAVSYIAVLLLAGVMAGYFEARAANARTDEMLSSRYVQMLDPYQNPGRL